MKERSAANQMDPLGWDYQSRMHGKPLDGDGPSPGEPADWSQCQHGTWWFLPWHRMYLIQFERIIRAFTEVSDWALPYWDYPNASEAEIPPSFLTQKSPLYNSTRTAIRSKYAEPTWQDAGTFTAFGGIAQKTPAHHGHQAGFLEMNPHNYVHGFVGGDMGDYQSPLDAVFWIHHCNIDRLWEAWLTQPGRVNPTENIWLDQTFDFPDPVESSGRRSLLISDIVSTAWAGYTYDDVMVAPVRRQFMLADMGPARQRKDDELELLGATTTSGSVQEAAQIGIVPEAAERHRALLADFAIDNDVPPLYLRLENVGMESGDASSMWNVYVGQSGSDERFLAGTIAPFGLAGLTASGGRQTITFDISGLGAQLLEGDSIEVTSEPAHKRVEGIPFWERAGLYTTAE
jgi:hypothetical protein